MKLLNYDLSEIKKVIETKAKFQKVMLLFDESVSEIELLEIYNAIKEICIFNKMDISNFDPNEINNGYRAIVYLCSATSFLKLNFDKSEFVNLCVVKGKEILPFCINNNHINKNDLYLFVANGGYDVNLFSSLSFNKFFNYLNNVVSLKENSAFNNPFDATNCLNICDCLKEVQEDFLFLDLDIIAKTNIELKHLSVLHLILINAFFIMINNVRNKTLMIVDVYKVCREDDLLLNRFYAMANNEVFYEMLNLNYNYLINFCVKTKEEILSKFLSCDMSESEMENILFELKNYAKNDGGVVGYLYLHDFFKV